MNIIQVEDNLKSVPDNRLQQEMSNPSGMFPQYLVMSEISRRAKMRTDYEGRMAANEKTPPRPTMREEMLMSMQSNIPSGGIADLVNSTQQSPNNAMPPISQEPVRMQAGTTVPFDPYGMFGFTFREDDPETEENESGYFREKSEVQKALEEYYKSRAKLMPEKLDKQRKLAGGLNLLQAGIAVGTSATPQQIGANLNNLIDGISKSEMQLTKQEDKLAKEQIDGLVAQAGFEKAERDDLSKATELKLKAEKEKATAEYMKGLGDKTSPVGRIADEIKAGKFGPIESLDIYTTKVNPKTRLQEKVIDPKKLLDLATQYQSSIGAAGIRTVGSKEEELAANVNKAMASLAVRIEEAALVKEGMSPEEAYNKIYNRIVAEQSKLLGIGQTKQTGGVIQSSVQDFNDVIENIGG
tara:strand:- start:345 stop:1577 length:1233 start_codon:yes stop_codon:yes gene_type:complete